MRRILGYISCLATEKLSSSSSYYSRSQSRQIFSAGSSSWQRNGGSKLSEALPGNHIKWASLGSVRNSQFASGFTPLKPKPLDSIMDLARAKTKSPEELTSAWDDVIFNHSLPLCSQNSVFNCFSVDNFILFFFGSKVSLRTRSYWDNDER